MVKVVAIHSRSGISAEFIVFARKKASAAHPEDYEKNMNLRGIL